MSCSAPAMQARPNYCLSPPMRSQQAEGGGRTTNPLPARKFLDSSAGFPPFPALLFVFAALLSAGLAPCACMEPALRPFCLSFPKSKKTGAFKTLRRRPQSGNALGFFCAAAVFCGESLRRVLFYKFKRCPACRTVSAKAQRRFPAVARHLECIRFCRPLALSGKRGGLCPWRQKLSGTGVMHCCRRIWPKPPIRRCPAGAEGCRVIAARPFAATGRGPAR